uniref:Ig-like domain-containing protein n=1 Tax=Gimesia maris TaxID=122 RepID=UPI003A90615C
MLFENWLVHLVSFPKKRRNSRTRYQRAQKVPSLIDCRLSLVERLEDRTLLTSIIGTTPDSTGTLDVDETSLEVIFSETVNGADVAANYVLVRAGIDGLLGSEDDVAVTVDSANYSSSTNTATLNFAALTEDIYRLTVLDTITDGSSNALDGDDDGSFGGNFTGDFVVGAMSTGLTSPGGVTFDPESYGFGAGQLVQGTDNAFDGLNRLQVGEEDFNPTVNLEPTVEVETLRVTSSVKIQADSFVVIPELSKTVTLTEETVFNLHATVLTHAGIAGSGAINT